MRKLEKSIVAGKQRGWQADVIERFEELLRRARAKAEQRGLDTLVQHASTDTKGRETTI